jgi:hypothetical protein
LKQKPARGGERKSSNKADFSVHNETLSRESCRVKHFAEHFLRFSAVFSAFACFASLPIDLMINFIVFPPPEANPMTARNFPASFWNSNYVPPTPLPTHHHQMSDLYSQAESGLYSTEPWVHNAAHYGSYAHAHAYHNMAQYGSLLRLPQQYGHSSR